MIMYFWGSDQATRLPADYLGRRDLGRIEPGARAGLVRLGKTLELEGVWIEGESVAISASQPEPAPAS